LGFVYNNSTITAGSGFTMRSGPNAGAVGYEGLESKSVTTKGAQTCTASAARSILCATFTTTSQPSTARHRASVNNQ